MSDQNQSQEQTQNAPTKKPWYKKWWVITIGVIVFIAIIGSSSEDQNTKQTSQAQPQQAENKVSEPVEEKEEKPTEPEKLTPQITVTSVNISKEYSENEVAGDEKYKGKIIEISGKVVSIDNGTFDNEMIVKLADGQYDFYAPWRYVKPSEKEKALSFKKSQQITLIGKGESATMKSPILKECTVK